MNTEKILKELERERDCISKAIAALQDAGGRGKSVAMSGRRTRRLSPAARRRISEAQKKRWAAQKKK